MAQPGKESFLNAVQLPADPPKTYCCNQYAALESLPPELVKRLRTLRAHHSVAEYSGDKLGVHPNLLHAEHPVVVRHPDTGHEALYVSKGITDGIIEMPKQQSSALLKQLHDHSTQPANVYGHHWQVGDLVMFDTFGSLHKRDAWDPTEVRVMRQLSTHV